MKKHDHVSLTAVALLLATVTTTDAVCAQMDRFNTLADLPFEQNRPTAETAKTLMEELDFQQAVQA